MIKILTVVGARPQFIKAATVSRVVREQHQGIIEECLVHTGQHFDDNMSRVFFDELDIPYPKYNLAIAGGGHGEMTGRMMGQLEAVLLDERPDWVLVYGDTNSTLAGALAAVKLHIPVAHVESGLRSFNMRMPEEVNRILSDRISSLLFCPTITAVENLAREGLIAGVFNVGDVMFDAAVHYKRLAIETSRVHERLGISSGQSFVLATCHRAENTDDAERLHGILSALSAIASRQTLVLPMHPRTRKAIDRFGLESLLSEVCITEPLPFLDMVALEQTAAVVLTDSGGVQKEAFFYGIPCVTMRDETEWTETLHNGWNTLAGADTDRILAAYAEATRYRPERGAHYGNGRAAQGVLQALLEQTT
jgi:UDP-GlcNAc3NAcA epimerase